MQLDFFIAVIEQSKLSIVQHQYQWNKIVSLQSKWGWKWEILLLYIFILWQKSEFPGISWSCQKKISCSLFSSSLIYFIIKMEILYNVFSQKPVCFGHHFQPYWYICVCVCRENIFLQNCSKWKKHILVFHNM